MFKGAGVATVVCAFCLSQIQFFQELSWAPLHTHPAPNHELHITPYHHATIESLEKLCNKVQTVDNYHIVCAMLQQ